MIKFNAIPAEYVSNEIKGHDYSAADLNFLEIRTIINIVSKLQHVNETKYMVPLLGELVALLGANGIALGVYNSEISKNICIASTFSKEDIPVFNKLPCAPFGCFRIQNDKHGNSSVFINHEGENFYVYLLIRLTEEAPSSRQEKIIQFIQQQLFETINRLYSISRTLFKFGLTAREQEVIQWIIEGKDNWTISKLLGVAERTVKFHNCNIYKKLGVSTRTEAICMYHTLTSSIKRASL